VAELELDPILAKAVDRRPTRRAGLSAVKEDLAFVLDRRGACRTRARGIRAAGGPMLADVMLFDEYAGEQVRRGQAQPGFSLTYQAPDRTLTDTDARRSARADREGLTEELGAVLRT